MATLLALGACGYDARPARMAVAPEAGLAPGALAAAVEAGDVSGGRELWALYITEVSGAAVTGAIRRSLAAHGMLAGRQNGRFRFEAQLADWSWPTHGDVMRVSVTLRCRLIAQGVGAPYWEGEAPASATATPTDAASGGARLRLAQEGAVRSGLRNCLAELSSVANAEPARFAPGALPFGLPVPDPPAGSPTADGMRPAG